MREKSIREIQKLGEEASTLEAFRDYNAELHQWSRRKGKISSGTVNKAITSLKNGKIDPIFALIKEIDECVSYYEKQLPNFFEKLYSYTNFHANHRNNVECNLEEPELILKSHITRISRLKEISALLKEKMVFSPNREFEKRLEKNVSEIDVSPQILALVSNPQLLKMIKNYAGTYQMNSSQ